MSPLEPKCSEEDIPCYVLDAGFTIETALLKPPKADGPRVYLLSI